MRLRLLWISNVHSEFMVEDRSFIDIEINKAYVDLKHVWPIVFLRMWILTGIMNFRAFSNIAWYVFLVMFVSGPFRIFNLRWEDALGTAIVMQVCRSRCWVVDEQTIKHDWENYWLKLRLSIETQSRGEMMDHHLGMRSLISEFRTRIDIKLNITPILFPAANIA